MHMRTIKELTKMNGRIYFLLRDQVARARFYLAAQEEGVCYRDGVSVLDRSPDSEMALNPDMTINFLGYAGNLAWRTADVVGGQKLIRVDMDRYLRGEPDYLLDRGRNMMKAVVGLALTDIQKKKLALAGSGCQIRYADPKQVTEEELEDAEIVIGNFPVSVLKKSPALKWVQLNSAGADAYIVPGALPDGTVLTNATGAYGKSVAEHTLAVMLALQKNIHLYRDEQRARNWKDFGQVASVSSSTVLVVGLGDIGMSFAKMVKSLGARVIGIRAHKSTAPEWVDAVYTTDELESVLPEADYVVSFLPGNRRTYHFYTRERFALMKKTAVFLNSGRGTAVDPEVLFDVLRAHVIAAAGIDVTDPEPLPEESLLWSLPNLLITPHVSGGNHLSDTMDRIVDIAAENLKAYLSGLPMKNVVDFETGYKKSDYDC